MKSDWIPAVDPSVGENPTVAVVGGVLQPGYSKATPDDLHALVFLENRSDAKGATFCTKIRRRPFNALNAGERYLLWTMVRRRLEFMPGYLGAGELSAAADRFFKSDEAFRIEVRLMREGLTFDNDDES